MKIKDCLRRHDSCVYCLEFPNGMKYVGKTKDLGRRMKLYLSDFSSKESGIPKHVSDFGVDNVDVRILFSMSGQKQEDKEICLSIMEIKYIRELNTLSPNGYNVSLGGEVLGIPIECLTTDKDVIKSFYKPNKFVLEYDLYGNFVKEYDSIARCAYEKGLNENTIRAYLTKMKPLNDSCYIREKKYDYIPPKIDVEKYEIKEKVKYKYTTVVEKRVVTKEVNHLEIPCIVYDYAGNFCGEFESLNKASLALGIHTRLTLGKYKSGYIAYKKVSNDYPKKIESKDKMYGYVMNEEYRPIEELELAPRMKETGTMAYQSKHEKLKLEYPIIQYKLNGEFVERYDSIRDAAHATGIQYSLIYACVTGKTRRSKGYIWKKAEEDSK